MSAALRLYEQLSEAQDDKTRARLIAEAFDQLEARFPQLGDLATQGHERASYASRKKLKRSKAGFAKKSKKAKDGCD